MFSSITTLGAMLSISFYLLTPEAKSQSQVYVSISDKTNRLRFATGESFLTDYCNIRKQKGGKDLVKKNSRFFLEYIGKLNEIRDTMHGINIRLSKTHKPTLEEIRTAYYEHAGKIKQPAITISELYKRFYESTESGWTAKTRKNMLAIRTHLEAFEESWGKINLESFDTQTWQQFRDGYFGDEKRMSNSSANKYLKVTKQILRFGMKRGLIKANIDLDDFDYLEEIEPFKVALKESEVEKLIELDNLTVEMEQVRDLFILEILTGQRFSDLPKLLDKKHISGTSIQIYQQKTNERVSIPIHPRLKKHLDYIFKRYDHLPVIGNHKFNVHLKAICKEAGFIKEHSWVKLVGKKQIKQSDFRFNLITSHTGRRTFCTLSMKRKINAEDIMKVTGHKNYEQFKTYVKVDDQDLETAYKMDLLK